MSDRSSQTSFTVSRNLKTTKNHFIEAKIDKLTEFVIPHQTIPTSTWLCMAYHLASTALHTIPNKHHFYFLKLSKYKTYKEESGGTWHIMSPPSEKVEGTRPPCPAPNCAHDSNLHDSNHNVQRPSCTVNFYVPQAYFLDSNNVFSDKFALVLHDHQCNHSPCINN